MLLNLTEQVYFDQLYTGDLCDRFTCIPVISVWAVCAHLMSGQSGPDSESLGFFS